MASSCFVIMPITTPAETLERYQNDRDHFAHVLDYLFTPALKKAGFDNVIRPAAEGADVIHAQIVKNLEMADMVLCDVSTLNPNVMFELGIRTALNRPVCMVRDEHLATLPFDTALINCHTYHSSLAPWAINASIEKLSSHIEATRNLGPDHNPLWKVFGLSQRAAIPVDVTEVSPLAAQIQLLTAEMAAMRREGAGEARIVDTPAPATNRFADVAPEIQSFMAEAADIAAEVNAQLKLVSHQGDRVVLDPNPYTLGESRRAQITNLGRRQGLEVTILKTLSA